MNVARPEPFHAALLNPGDGAPPRFSLAATLEEPDLAVSAGHAASLLNSEHPSPLEALRLQGRLTTLDKPGFIVARVIRGPNVTTAVYCRYPLKLVRELAESKPLTTSDAYVDACRRNRAILDPLVLAFGGIKASVVEDLGKLGDECFVVHANNAQARFRLIADDKGIRSLLKVFEPAIFGAKPDPFVLDGPIGMARKLLERGDEHIFACLVPVGDGAGRLLVNDLGITRAPEAVDALTFKALGEKMTAGAALRVYRYLDDEERVRVKADWEEDLRIESRTSDCCGVLLEGEKAFGLVVGERNRYSGGVATMYGPDGVIAGSQRGILEPQNDAVFVRTLPDGLAACVWTPSPAGFDITSHLLARRPPMHVRRAMVGLAARLPHGVVLQSLSTK